MARVYVSSTISDLGEERRAAMDWLISAGHQVVTSYAAASETIREHCLNDLDACDLYVLILGHRYGFVPIEDNPETLSITHLEFRRAGDKAIPRIALLRTSVPDVALSDLTDPHRTASVLGFRKEVEETVRPAQFKNSNDMILALSTSVRSELDRIDRLRKKHDLAVPPGRSVFVCYARTDEGLVIPFATALRDQGVPVWLDQWNIPAGGDWDKEIETALYGCTEFLIALTPAAVDSDEVRGELRVVLNERKPVIPVVFRQCRIPRRLMLRQHIDFTNRHSNDPAGLTQVIEALRDAATGDPEEV